MTVSDPQSCRLCGGSYTIRSVIEAAHRYWPSLHLVYSRRTCCGATEEFEVQPGKVVIGYIYAAGAPHFCGMEEYDAPGLTLNCEDGIYSLRWDNHTIPLETVVVARRAT